MLDICIYIQKIFIYMVKYFCCKNYTFVFNKKQTRNVFKKDKRRRIKRKRKKEI